MEFASVHNDNVEEGNMDERTAKGIKARLDDELSKVGPNVGIAFGFKLFGVFRELGWLTLHKFGVLGTRFASLKLPAYRSHFAFTTWDIPENEFKVGRDA